MRHTLALSLLLLAAQSARADFWNTLLGGDYAVATTSPGINNRDSPLVAINQYGDLAVVHRRMYEWLNVYAGPTSWDQQYLDEEIGSYSVDGDQEIQFAVTPAGDFDVWAGLGPLTFRETIVVDHNRKALGSGQIAGELDCTALATTSGSWPSVCGMESSGFRVTVAYVATPRPVPEPQALLLFATVIIASLRHGLRRARVDRGR